jgi:hypothetical protein
MKNLFCISLLLITAISADAQTRQITAEEWRSVMRDRNVRWTPPVGPYRLIRWSNTFDLGDSHDLSSSRIVTEYLNAKEGREVSEGRMGMKGPFRNERIWKDGVEYVRVNGGKWTRKQKIAGKAEPGTVIGKNTDSTKPGPNGEPPTYARKPGAEEMLYFALGERLYKGQTVAVYEQASRHVLIRLSDKSEVHYEDRTRSWVNDAGKIIRTDRHTNIYTDQRTTRMLSGTEWENDPAIKPVVLPVD